MPVLSVTCTKGVEDLPEAVISAAKQAVASDLTWRQSHGVALGCRLQGKGKEASRHQGCSPGARNLYRHRRSCLSRPAGSEPEDASTRVGDGAETALPAKPGRTQPEAESPFEHRGLSAGADSLVLCSTARRRALCGRQRLWCRDRCRIPHLPADG